MSSIKLQDAVSRPETVSYGLSCSAWQDGHYTFYRNAVPFSFYTGHVYADQLARFFVGYAARYPKESYYIYELGAGTGMLSKHVLDRIRLHSKPLYEKTFVGISDSSVDLIRDLERSRFFAGHEGRYRIEVMDALQPSFSDPADLVFFSNLIDSTPCHHFEVVDGKAVELFIETTVPDIASIVDGSTLPPKTYSGTDILNLMDAPNQDQAFAIRTQLGVLLDEHMHRVPLSESGLTSAEIEKVQGILEAQKLQDGDMFNVHFEALEAVESMLNQSADTGVVILSDFGFYRKNIARETSDLSKRYNNHFFTSVFFDLFYLTANTFSTMGLEKQSETVALFKDSSAASLRASCRTLFEPPNATIATIDSIAKLNGTEDLEKFQQILKSLPKLCHINISFMTYCLSYHLSSGHVDLVKLLATQMIELYGDLAIMGYYFRGVILMVTQDFSGAKESFEKLLEITNGQFYQAYAHLAQMAEGAGEDETAVDYYQKLLHFGATEDKKAALEALGGRVGR